MPADAEINNAMQDATDTLCVSSKQHKELGHAKTAKDPYIMMPIAFSQMVIRSWLGLKEASYLKPLARLIRNM